MKETDHIHIFKLNGFKTTVRSKYETHLLHKY